MLPTYLLARDHLQRAAAIIAGEDSRSRQLRYIIERTVIMAPTDRLGRIDVDLLPSEVLDHGGSGEVPQPRA